MIRCGASKTILAEAVIPWRLRHSRRCKISCASQRFFKVSRSALFQANAAHHHAMLGDWVTSVPRAVKQLHIWL